MFQDEMGANWATFTRHFSEYFWLISLNPFEQGVKKMFRAKLINHFSASGALILTFISGLFVNSFPRFSHSSSIDALSGFLTVLFFLFLFIGILSSLIALIAIFMRLRFRWILIFTLLSFLGSGVCFLRYSIMSFTSLIALLIVLINYNDFKTRNLQYAKNTNWD